MTRDADWYEERLMDRYEQVTLAAAVLIAVLEVLVLGAGSAAQAAPFPPCDLRLRVELSPDGPNPRDAGFVSSLLGNHPDYRLTLQQQDPESASLFTLELTGPGPEAGCGEVVDSMRNDARVVSVEVLLDAASTALPVSAAPLIGSAQAVSTLQPMGTMRSEPDGDWALEPRNGVSYAQVARDRYECDLWAVDQTGFDPTKDDGGLPPSGVTAKRADYLRAEAACLQAHGYVVR
jgi:hypothetical protein